MSLAIVTDRVEAVLLADGWHKVKGQSFDLDAYEYLAGDAEKNRLRLGGGAEKEAGVPATGAIWQEPNGKIIACPLTAVLAVRLKTWKKSSAPSPTPPGMMGAGRKRESAGWPGPSGKT